MPPPCSAFPRRQLSWPGLHRGREVSAQKEEPHVVVEHMRRHLGQSLIGFNLKLETASPWLIGVHR